jgi:DMSO/TMAO reductase YedYZ heme-binding membrane subunit
VSLLAATGNAKALWYLTRGTGAVALLLLTAGLVLGIAGSTRWRRPGTPRFVVAALHRNVTLLAVAFVVAHVLTTLADGFAPIRLRDAVVPFASAYRPVWLGLGAVAFDLLLALIATSLLRARIGARTWRAVHWLAYVSWPVALVHALGTGSDARTGWLAALAVASTAAVVLAVLWRVFATEGRSAARIAAGLAALCLPFAILAWARSGPLAPGWAARAGTPATLLPARAVAARTTAAVKPGATLPSGPFAASFAGRLRQSPGANGLVVVAIDGVARGGFRGRVHVALRGVALENGGVRMLDSSVGLLPHGAAAWYAGSVVGLEGARILADVHGDGGRHVHLLLSLRISGSGAVSGSLRTTSAQVGPSE